MACAAPRPRLRPLPFAAPAPCPRRPCPLPSYDLYVAKEAVDKLALPHIHPGILSPSGNAAAPRPILGRLRAFVWGAFDDRGRRKNMEGRREVKREAKNSSDRANCRTHRALKAARTSPPKGQSEGKRAKTR